MASRLSCCPTRSSKVLERLSELELRQTRVEDELRACSEAVRRNEDEARAVAEQARAAAEQVEATGRAAEKAMSLAEAVSGRVEQMEAARHGEPPAAPQAAPAEPLEGLLARIELLERRLLEPTPPVAAPLHQDVARELAVVTRQTEEGIARAEQRLDDLRGEMRSYMAATDQLLEQVCEGRGSIAAGLEQVSGELSSLEQRVQSRAASRLLLQQACRKSRLAPKRRSGVPPSLVADVRSAVQRALEEAGAAARCGLAAREAAEEGLALARGAVEQLEMLGLPPPTKGVAAGERRRTLEDRLQSLQRELHAMDLGARSAYRQPLERKAAELRAEVRCASDALQVRMDSLAEEFRAATGSVGADLARARSEVQSASERSGDSAAVAAEALEATRWLKLLVAELEAGKASRHQLESVTADFRSDLAGCVGALRCELERTSAAVHGVVGELSLRVDSQREAAFRMVDGRDIQRQQDQREFSDALDGLRLSCEQHEAELVGRIQTATSAQAVFASNILPELKVVKDMKEHFYALEMSVAELKSKVLVVEAANVGSLSEKPAP